MDLSLYSDKWRELNLENTLYYIEACAEAKVFYVDEEGFTTVGEAFDYATSQVLEHNKFLVTEDLAFAARYWQDAAFDSDDMWFLWALLEKGIKLDENACWWIVKGLLDTFNWILEDYASPKNEEFWIEALLIAASHNLENGFDLFTAEETKFIVEELRDVFRPQHWAIASIENYLERQNDRSE